MRELKWILSFVCLLGVFNQQALAAECVTPENGDTPAIQPTEWVEGQGGPISNLCELRWLSESPQAWAWGAEYWLTADIDASPTRYWHNGLGFSPIGLNMQRELSFDGRGHQISGLTIYRPTQDNVGLFSYLREGSYVRNLRLIDVDIVGSVYVGAVAAYAYEISDVFVSGKISGVAYLGGVVGYGGGPSNRIEANVDIKATGAYVGGIIGLASTDSTHLNLVSHGVMDSEDAGGIIGTLGDGALLANSYSTVKGVSQPFHGLVSAIEQGSRVETSYFDCEVGGQVGDEHDCWDGQTGSETFGRTTEQLNNPQTFIDAGWSQGSAWQSGTWRLEHHHYPTLQHPDAPLFVEPTSVEPSYTLDEDSAFELMVEARSQSGDEIRYSLNHAPSWLKIDHNGTISGTPSYLAVGRYDGITVQTKSGDYLNQLPTFSVVVKSVNDSPTVVPGHIGVLIDNAGSLDLSRLVIDEAGESRDYQFEVQSAQHGEVTLSGTVVTYQHGGGESSVDSFDFIVIDGEHRVVNSVLVEVFSAPTLTEGMANIQEDTSLVFDLADLAVGINTPNFAVSTPSYGSASLSGTWLTYTPNEHFHGSDSLTISELDSGLTSTLTVNIYPVSDPLLVNNAVIELLEDTPITMDLADFVVDVDHQPLIFSITQPPTQGALSLEDSTVRYWPNRDVNGTDAFEFTVNDGVRPKASAIATLTILPVNDPPQVRNEVYSTYQEKVFDIASLVQDVDGELSADQVAISVSPTLGSLEQIDSSTQWRYTPSGPVGQDVFTFTVNDGEFSVDFNVTMHVTTAPQEPIFDAQGRGIIANLANLRWLSEEAFHAHQNKSWILSADIDAAETHFWHFADVDQLASTQNQAQGFKPIDVNIEHLIGNGHVISNLHIFRPFEIHVGVFGMVEALSVHDIRFENVDITGNSRVGGLFGALISTDMAANDRMATIENVLLEGKIAGSNPNESMLGGLIGTLHKPLELYRVGIEMSAQLEDNYFTGGLIGYPTQNVSFTESYAAVSANKNLSGGLFGASVEGTELRVKNSLVVVNSYEPYGPTFPILPTVTNSFFNRELCASQSGCDPSMGGRTTDQLKTPSTFIGEGWRWDASTPWSQGGWILQAGEYPQLRWEAVPLFTQPSAALTDEQVDQDARYQRQFTAIPIVDGVDVSYRVASTLPSWLTLDANGLLSGTPSNDDVGTLKDVVIEVVEGEHINRMLAFDIEVINVNDAPTISGTPATQVQQDSTYRFAPVSQDIDVGDELFFFISNQPRWLQFDSQTGAISGTPTNNDVGRYDNIAIAVGDGQYFAALPPFSITVENVNDAPVISGTPAHLVKQDARYYFAPTASDIDVGDTLMFSIINKPSWAKFEPITGTLSGVPLNEHVGTTEDIVISVSDGDVTVNLPPFTLTVENINDTPVISGTPATRVKQDTRYLFEPNATDIDALDTLTFSIHSLPVWATFNPTTGTVSGTPTNQDVGVTEGIVISVTDGTETVALPAFSITVENVNDLPEISGSPATRVSQDTAYYFKPAASDIDADTVLRFSIINKPVWATFDEQEGILAGTPSNDHVGVTESIVISVSDGEATVSLPTFAISVDNVNDAPTISGVPTTEVDQDVSYNFTPYADDIDAQDTLTFSIENKPAWAQFDVSTGALYGVPTENDVGVTAGIVISVSDGVASASLAPFSVNVRDINNGPTAINDTFAFAAPEPDERYVLNVMQNDSHIDDFAFHLVSATTQQGNVAIVGDTLELMLDAAYSSVSVSYFVEDTEGLTSQASVQLTIERDTDIVFEAVDDVIVDATGTLTKVSLTAPYAHDGAGIAVPVELVGGKTHFVPGRHELVWQAEKSDGSKITETQILRVNPIVSLPSSVRVAHDTQQYQLEVLLNGDLAFDQLEVPYSLDGIEQAPLVIQGDSSGHIVLTSLSAGESYTIVLDRSLNLGENATFTLTVSDTFVLPKVSAVLSQKDEARSWICQQQGEVEIDVVVENATDSDVFTIMPLNEDWVRVSDDAHSARFVALASALDIGSTYAAFSVVNDSALALDRDVAITHVSYFDVAERLSQLSNLLDSDSDGIPDALEGYQDSDGDGVPDYLDAVDAPNIQPSRSDNQANYLAETESGARLATGASKYSDSGLLVDSHRLPMAEGHWYHSGVFDFIIDNIPETGGLVSVVLPQQQALAAGVTYRKLVGEQWVDFVVDEASSGYPNGALHSAQGEAGICPPPLNPEKMQGGRSEVWTPGLTQGHWCIQVSLRDGGRNDADGLVNGAIVDPSGAMSIYPAPVAVEDSYTITMNSQASWPVLENDRLADPEASIHVVDAYGAVGDVSHDGENVFFTPPKNQTGWFTLGYTIRNQWGVSHSASIRVHVQAPERDHGGGVPIWVLAGLVWLLMGRAKHQ